jgi:hypothetical protein
MVFNMSNTDQINPLTKHFRQPQLYLKLPSRGCWYIEGSLSMPPTGELPVYAMTARDELTLKTPDALLNGQATVDVIQSCVPNIKNAWRMPIVDLDAVLIAIRKATYGPGMEFASLCPHCGSKNEHTANLDGVSAGITCPDFDGTILADGLEFFIRPQTYEQFNKTSLENYEQQRILSVVTNDQLSSEEKIANFTKLFNRLLDMTVEQVAKSVAAIKTQDGVTVEDHKFIDEYFRNCNRPAWDAIKGKLTELGSQNPVKNIDVTCENEDCLKSYTTPLLFETSSFFG